MEDKISIRFPLNQCSCCPDPIKRVVQEKSGFKVIIAHIAYPALVIIIHLEILKMQN